MTLSVCVTREPTGTWYTTNVELDNLQERLSKIHWDETTSIQIEKLPNPISSLTKWEG
jgi:mRNA-degrading endonuclease toxin of MazEF toxin-antitoxin module